jgi:hypothetical protein
VEGVVSNHDPYSDFCLHGLLKRVYKVSSSDNGCGQNTVPVLAMGWNDPTVHFGHAAWQKVGSFQPSPRFARAQILRRAQRNLAALQHFGSPCG